MKALILKKYGNLTGRRFAAVEVENFGRIDVLIRGPKDGATTNDFGDYHPTEETRIKPIKEKAEFLLKQRHAMNLKRNPKKRAAKKRTTKKTAKRTVKKKAVRRTNPKVMDYFITSTKRKRDAGDTKETKMVWLWEGVGWTTDKNKAARYHDPNQANKIALLIVDNPKLHNATRRQLAVAPDTSHPK